VRYESVVDDVAKPPKPPPCDVFGFENMAVFRRVSRWSSTGEEYRDGGERLPGGFGSCR
jgi:hypothetical protein